MNFLCNEMFYKQYINLYVHLIYIFQIDNYNSTFLTHEIHTILITCIYLLVSIKTKANLKYHINQ